MKKALSLIIGLTIAALTQTAFAVTLDFEDVPAGWTYVPLSSYQGFDWTNAYVMDPWQQYGGQYLGWGYSVGQTTSGGSNIAWGIGSQNSTISDPDRFDWVGANFTHYGGGLNLSSGLQIWGSYQGNQSYHTTITVNSWQPTYFAANWQGIDLLTFRMNDNLNWVMDDFEFTAFVPEPGAAILLLLRPSYTLTRHCILPNWRHSEDQPSMKASRMV